MDSNKRFDAQEAVIDKDLASSLLASDIKADEFFIITDVPKVYINFGKPDQKQLDTITLDQAKKYMEEGHFASGSMGPKVQACISYIENGGKETIITEASELEKEKCGTRIVANK